MKMKLVLVTFLRFIVHKSGHIQWEICLFNFQIKSMYTKNLALQKSVAM